MVRMTGLLLGAMIALTGCGLKEYRLPFAAADKQVRLLSLTSLESDAAEQTLTLRAYVQFGEGVEADRMRFELYEYTPRAANPRGRRIALWSDIEPGPAATTNRRWKPHLDAYEFVLPVEGAGPAAGKTCLAEVTVFQADGKYQADTLKVMVTRK